MEAWKEQLKDPVRTLKRLRGFINVTPDEEKAITTLNTRWGTTPYFASLMDKDDPNCPIRKQVVPSMKEAENKYGMKDYLHWKEKRERDRPDCLGRHYKNRVAFTAVGRCPSYCRFCFRREVTIDDSLELRFDVNDGFEWIEKHPEIEEILYTGGEPFLFNDEQIKYLIERGRSIPHVQRIRFHTKTPIVLPQRITSNLEKVLSGNHKVPIRVNIHCNHPKEITQETREAVHKIQMCGIPVGNQSVLLKGINDDLETFRALNKALLNMNVTPYYLYYLELVKGIDHFRTKIKKGCELIHGIIGEESGHARPLYVIPTREGKIPVTSDFIVKETKEEITFRNYKGQEVKIPDMPD
jgi:lysine 2,3-aminomutase